jgi:hypothetical protein
MNKRTPIVTGIILILVGILALACNLVLWARGIDAWRLVWWGWWRLWPLAVVGIGLLLGLPPFLVRKQPAWGALFILSFPTMATGGILLFNSLLDAWGAWAWLWPVELLAIAFGFLCAAIYARSAWLLIPAIILGLNGLAFQFCAATGLWSAWAWLWTIEPLAIGVSLLVASVPARSGGLFAAGLVVCGLSAMAMAGMTSLISVRWWPVKLLGPALLILSGVVLLVWGLVRRPSP